MNDPQKSPEHGQGQPGAALSPGDADTDSARQKVPGTDVEDPGGRGEAAPIRWPPSPARQRRIDVGDVELDVVESGKPGHPAVVLLHGFPELSYGWRHQVQALVESGFHVLAPDQRGYAGSDRPAEIDSYRIDRLAGDVVGLLDALGLQRAHLVGHDWGAMVAWWTAIAHPDRVRRLVILNVPHPAVMRRALRRNPRQILRSLYVFFFQLPRLPEAMLGWRDFAALARTMRRTSRPGTFDEAEMERYRDAWRRPGALRAMLHWYRATRRSPPLPAGGRVRPPTLVLWGAGDVYLGTELAAPSADRCDDGRLVLLEGCTHWLHHEDPERVNHEIALHLGAETRPPRPGADG